MASPKTVSQVRKIIRSEELINKVQAEVLDKDEFKMSTAEVGAIKLLLNKVIPDLKGIEHSGNIDSEVTRKHRVSFRRG